jgi:hypothetical protein
VAQEVSDSHAVTFLRVAEYPFNSLFSLSKIYFAIFSEEGSIPEKYGRSLR